MAGKWSIRLAPCGPTAGQNSSRRPATQKDQPEFPSRSLLPLEWLWACSAQASGKGSRLPGVKARAGDLWDAIGNQPTNAVSTVEGASAKPSGISGSVTSKLGDVERRGVMGSCLGGVENRNSANQIGTRQPKVLVARHNDTANESSSVESNPLRFEKGFVHDQAFNLRENRRGKRGERSGNYSGQAKQFVWGRKAKAFQLAERFLDCLRLKPSRSRKNENCELADPGEFQLAEKSLGPDIAWSAGPSAGQGAVRGGHARRVFQEGIIRTVVIKQPPNSSCDFCAHRVILGFAGSSKRPARFLPANDKFPPAPQMARVDPC
jgi:hypothetical protein